MYDKTEFFIGEFVGSLVGFGFLFSAVGKCPFDHFPSSSGAFPYLYLFAAAIFARGLDKFIVVIHPLPSVCHQWTETFTFPRKRSRGGVTYLYIFLYTYISAWIILFEVCDINYIEFFKMSMSMSIFSRSLWLLIFLGLSSMNVVQVRGHFGAVRMENEGNLLSPRYYMGLTEGRLLERDTGVCASGFHSCNYSQSSIFIFPHPAFFMSFIALPILIISCAKQSLITISFQRSRYKCSNVLFKHRILHHIPLHRTLLLRYRQ